MFRVPEPDSAKTKLSNPPPISSRTSKDLRSTANRKSLPVFSLQTSEFTCLHWSVRRLPFCLANSASMVCAVFAGGGIHTVTIDRSGSSEACMTSSFAAGLMSLYLPIADFKNSKEFLFPQLTTFTLLTQSAPLKDTSSDPPSKMAISSISLPSIDCQKSVLILPSGSFRSMTAT
ncbi:hypothetical protein FF38_08839 [Lucilia cuprina]|uniref:Uncharacterized protein n=1 Tax=Lucilia cuprina TaxID=7375 RepID=A0A0L0C8J9_LUCCU|nr:hypothetical protein FF38_08839 [Lucilia cuprina]